MNRSRLDEHELNVLTCLVHAWNAFVELPVEHQDDLNEFRLGIHQLQEKILARPARRVLSEMETRV